MKQLIGKLVDFEWRMIYALRNLISKHLTKIIETINAIFATQMNVLYLSYVEHPEDTVYQPTGWDYTYYLSEKIFYLLFFLCLIPFTTIKRILVQTIALAIFSLIRMVWQITEISNQTFGTGIMPQFVLSLIVTGIVIYMIIQPFIKTICIQLRFLRK